MTARAAALSRILDVQRQMLHLAEWAVAAIDREADELQRRERELVAALDDGCFAGLFVASMARRLRALSDEGLRLRNRREAEVRARLAIAQRLKRAERLLAQLARDEARAREGRDLAALIDLLAGRAAIATPPESSAPGERSASLP